MGYTRNPTGIGGWRPGQSGNPSGQRKDGRPKEFRGRSTAPNPTGIGGFKPGVSGNPSGLPKNGEPKARSLSELAREYTDLCVTTLVEIVKKGAERNKLAAAMALLDRGYGKPIQQIDALVVQRKINEMSEGELIELEARLITSTAVQPDTPPPVEAVN